MRSLLISAALLLTGNAFADLSNTQLPAGSAWYVHVALDTMRDSEAGKPLYRWLQDEVLEEANESLEEEFDDAIDLDLDRDIERITAYGNADGDVTAIITGNISTATRDKLMSLADEHGTLDSKRTAGKTYYHLQGMAIDEKDLQVEADELFFSFDGSKRLILGTHEKNLQAAMRQSARRGNAPSAMLVLSADRELVQGGVNTDEFGDNDSFSFNSGLLKQTRELAFVLADSNGDIDLQLSITADDPEATNSLAAVVRGLIGLQALSGEGNPELRKLLNSVQVNNDSRGLTLRLVTAPDTVLRIIED
ncbi:MAG: hypothetical protein AAFO81_05430 [Pseudomonadota bacterium]